LTRRAFVRRKPDAPKTGVCAVAGLSPNLHSIGSGAFVPPSPFMPILKTVIRVCDSANRFRARGVELLPAEGKMSGRFSALWSPAWVICFIAVCAISVSRAQDTATNPAERPASLVPPPPVAAPAEVRAESASGSAVPLPPVVVTGTRPPRQASQHQSRPVQGLPPSPANPSNPPAAPPQPSAPSQAAPSSYPSPPGQTITTIPREVFKQAPAFSIGEILQDSPGVSIKQGNGPRDVGISIRGSNARNGFGIRNIVVLDDGFPVTQPDGLSRSDLIDPHAYGAIDVYRGPSSAMFGNYATGGAINFRTRAGATIGGVEYGSDIGSFGYFNNYLALGARNGPEEHFLFASDVRGDGFIQHSGFDTQTVNFLGNYAAGPQDRVTVKVIDNQLATDLAIRLSLNQFLLNPFQRGCIIASAAVPGCATVNLFVNGFSAPTVAQTADQAGLGRHDRRTIVGTRWEHDFDANTTWRTQIVFDDKDINQPTGATSAIGDSPAYNVITDLTQRGTLLGLDATHYAAFFYNSQALSNFTYNVAPGGNATLGRLSSFYDGGQHINFGGRAREDVKFSDAWTGVAAFGLEHTTIETVDTVYSFPPGKTVATLIPVDREFLNAAPEAGLRYRPNDAWQLRGRVATGYGTPQVSSLFVTPQGVSGDNTQLKTQTNLGFDAGVDWTPSPLLTVSLTGFYEFFRNEFVTQSPGAGLQNFTFNVPASQHRGVELGVDWRPSPGWRLFTAYTFMDQVYTQYVEQLSAGALTRSFDRAGNKIPGISPNELTSRLGYDQPAGPWKGWGGFVEYVWKDSFFMESANLLKAPGYQIVNLNLHYDTAVHDPVIKGMTVYFEVKNVLDKTYVASANNITDSISAATGAENPASVLANATGSIYAGAPRTFIGGLRLRL
jgi:iron complex outermembrane receptor protein